MNTIRFLETRSRQWSELESLLHRSGWSRLGVEADRLAFLYRAVCADLALAEAHNLPEPTVRHLHRLVARAHNRLYASPGLNLAAWARAFFVDLPRDLRQDRFLRVAGLLFWGGFAAAMLIAYLSPSHAEQLLGRPMMESLDTMYETAPTGRKGSEALRMMGFYILNNTGIGLRQFASGLVFGVLGLPTLMFNAAILGACFGYMAAGPRAENFLTFVTAHGPFELNAVVLAAAAGMRIGWSLIDTGGYDRTSAMRRAATAALPMAGLSVLFFLLAAVIEGFVSPSSLPYSIKAAVAVASVLVQAAFMLLGGRGRSAPAGERTHGTR